MKSLLLSKGLLSQSNTVGSLVWTGVKDIVSKSQKVEEQPAETTEDEDKDKVPLSEVEQTDIPDENKQENAFQQMVSAYNCVVYGLPHITLIAPP